LLFLNTFIALPSFNGPFQPPVTAAALSSSYFRHDCQQAAVPEKPTQNAFIKYLNQIYHNEKLDFYPIRTLIELIAENPKRSKRMWN
jgi:hypothetical protein